jgi:GAF domain-containing protein
MSQIYDALKRLEAKRDAERHRSTPSPAVPLDAIRVEQFLDLQRELLCTGGPGEELPDRLVQGVAIFFRVAGAAVGVMQDGLYRVLGTYGLGAGNPERLRGHGPDSPLAHALTTRRPLVLQHAESGTPVRNVVLPFHARDFAGALHLVMPESETLSDEDLQLARAVAGMVGLALANARLSPN